MTLNSGSAGSVKVPLDIPSGYGFGGIVGVTVSEWHCAISKIDYIWSEQAASINLVNAGSAKQTVTVSVRVLLLPS